MVPTIKEVNKIDLTFKNDSLLREINLSKYLSKYSVDDWINIFPIFLKKKDFIKKNQINNNLSSRVPFLAGNELKRYIIKNIELFGLDFILEKYVQYMGYPKKDKAKHLFHLKKRVKNWIENSYFPLPLIRILIYLNGDNELSSVFGKIKYVTDYQHRCKFYYPRKIKGLFDKWLIYFVGCVFGDGAVYKDLQMMIVDGHPNKKEVVYSKEFLTKIKNKLDEKYKINSYFTKQKGNVFLLRLTNKWFIRFLLYIFNIPSGRKINLQLPNIVKRSKLQKYFWRGLFDTDGCVSKSHRAISFSSSSKSFLMNLSAYLNKNKIACKITKLKNKYGVWYSCYIHSFEFKRFCELIGSSHPRKQKLLAKALEKGSTETIFKGHNKSLNIPRGLLKIARFMRSKNKYVIFIRRKDGDIILTDQQLNEMADKVENKFNVKRVFEDSKKTPYFYSTFLSKLFSTYFKYEKPWQSTPSDSFLKKWNEIWIN